MTLQSLAANNAPVPSDARGTVETWVKELKESHGGQGFKAPNFKEIDLQDLYYTNFLEYSPVEEGYGTVEASVQICGREFTTNAGHWYVYHDGTGIFVMRTWGPKATQLYEQTKESQCRVRFFSFGCNHNYEQTRNLGRCYNEYQCKNCGHVKTVDSSD